MANLPLGCIGVGNMGAAIIGGIRLRCGMAPQDIGLFDLCPEKLEPFKSQGHPVFPTIPDLVRSSNAILLCCKPQNFSDVLPEMAKAMTPDKLIISIAAGIGAERIKQGIGFDCKVVLVMPNTPLMLGFGATAMCRVEPTTPEEFQFAKTLFEAVGIAEEIPPELMTEVIPVNGSAPAVVYLLAKLLADCAEQAGIDRAAAARLVTQTLLGSAHMLASSGKGPQELIDMVCSPGGTTVAGLAALLENGFEKSAVSYFDACTRRARELAEGK